MQQKHRYDLNDLYAMFRSIGIVRIANLRGAFQFYVAFHKRFPDTSRQCTEMTSLRKSVRKLQISEVRKAGKSYFRSSTLHGLDHVNS